MHTAVRPWVMSGAALVGASVIAVTPIAPPPQALVPQVHIPEVHFREVHMPAVQLSASIADIFTFPALRQYILNRIDDIATLSVGLAGSAVGLVQSIAMIPSTVRTVTQQVLTGDLLGALTTIQVALVDSIVAVGEPTLDAIIERRQRVLAVAEALQAAVPEAFFSVVGGFGRAIDEVVRAFIVAGQGLVDAVLSLNLGNIAGALVTGTTLVLGSFVDAGQHVVDGIVTAQQTIATALATQPDPAVATAFNATVAGGEVTDVPDVSRKTAMVAVSPSEETAETPDTDPTGISTQTTSEAKTAADQDTPKTHERADESAAKGDESAPADKPAPPAKSATHGTEKKADASPKHENDTSPRHESKNDDTK